MLETYAALLRLYPAEHTALFADEMLATFERAAADWRSRGAIAFFGFAAWELAGLLGGSLAEHFAKWRAGDNYLSECVLAEAGDDLPADAAELERRVARALRGMEFAIAHHNFPKARYYSEEERVARAQLEQLLRKPRWSGESSLTY